MAKIEAGSVVRMKHEGENDTSMTVGSVYLESEGNMVANVVWFDAESHLCRAIVPVVALKLWPEANTLTAQT